MKHLYQVNHAAVAAQVCFDPGAVEVHVQRPVSVGLESVQSGSLRLHVDGVTHWAEVVHDGRTTWVHVDGQTFRLRESMPVAAAAAKGAVKLTIHAPMTGKVTHVLVKSGDGVVAGQELVKMEAMKMEYTLHAESAGRVETVLAVAGAVVEAETVLLQLAAPVNQD